MEETKEEDVEVMMKSLSIKSGYKTDEKTMENAKALFTESKKRVN